MSVLFPHSPGLLLQAQLRMFSFLIPHILFLFFMVSCTTIPFSSTSTGSSGMFSIFPPLFFLLSAVGTGATEPTLAAPLLLLRPRNPPKPDCSSACQLIALPDESGQSLFSKLCGAAVPDESCTKFGQLETKVRVSGSSTQDILIKCLCSPNGNGVEISRSEVSVEGISPFQLAECKFQCDC